MRRQAGIVTNTQIDFRLAEPDRFQLRMDVGNMDQGHIAHRIELQQLILCQGLLRGKA